MIARDSVLRRLPTRLDPRQLLFLDGIRHAGDIAGFAYGRLLHTLTQIATADHQGEQADRLYTMAFLDAWAVVDVIDRFRALLLLMPNAVRADPPPGTMSFTELTQPVRELRNVADHLAQRIDYVIARQGTALGTLSWFTALRPDGIEGVICTIVPGTLRTGATGVINPTGQTIELPTGFVQLSAGEHKANLSAIIPEMMLRVRQIEDSLTEGLRAAGAENEQAGADLLIRMNVSFATGEAQPMNPTSA